MLRTIGSPPRRGHRGPPPGVPCRIRSFSDLAVRLGRPRHPPLRRSRTRRRGCGGTSRRRCRCTRGRGGVGPAAARGARSRRGRGARRDAPRPRRARGGARSGAGALRRARRRAGAPRELAPALARAGHALRAHFEAHLASEEATIFPALARSSRRTSGAGWWRSCGRGARLGDARGSLLAIDRERPLVLPDLDLRHRDASALALRESRLVST